MNTQITLEKIISAIKGGDDDRGRDIFNAEIRPILEQAGHTLPQREKLFFYELDEYFNNESARIVGASDAKSILSSYEEISRDQPLS